MAFSAALVICGILLDKDESPAMNDAALIAPVIMFSAVLVITLALRHNAKKRNDGKDSHQAGKTPPTI